MSLQALAHWFAGRASVFEIESAIVLGAFDHFPNDESSGKVSAAMSTDTIGGIEVSVFVAINGVGLFALIEAEDVFFLQGVGWADFSPTVLLKCGSDLCRRNILRRARFGKGSFDVVAGVFGLPGDGRDDFLPA